MKAAGGSHASWDISCPSQFHKFQNDTLPICEYSSGDVNAADLVSMSRFLHGISTAENFDSVLSDLDFSGNADVFDLILLRRKLLSR